MQMNTERLTDMKPGLSERLSKRSLWFSYGYPPICNTEDHLKTCFKKNLKIYVVKLREGRGPVWTPLWTEGCHTVGALLGLEDMICVAVSSLQPEKNLNFCSHPAGTPRALPSSSWWSSSGSWWNYLSCWGAVILVFTYFYNSQTGNIRFYLPGRSLEISAQRFPSRLWAS